MKEVEHAEKADRGYRLPIKLLVTFESEKFNGNFFIENLSSGGLFIATDSPLHKGVRIKIQFMLPHNRLQYTVDALIAWSRDKPKNGSPAGMGVRFASIDKEYEALLKQAIEQYKKIID